ncbi:MAG TPA: hypothetical protein VLF18_14170 [Tahibacter sp.]|uniref:hypothetical protein n=1 Tax=Tahibacter sp. TaxID=2056211 RepID=UPI002CA6D8FA|nr:hypothetical protein [Tahibacter sp.]HSX61343.1 hypothetical protein [Tahibacter sp.]
MASDSPDFDDVIEIPYSRVKLTLLTLVCLSLAGLLGFWAYVLFASGSPMLYLIGIGPALFLLGLLPASVRLIRAWLHDGPVVTMDADGIRDTRQPDDFIEWTDVAEIELGIGSASCRLCFTFRDAERERGGLRAVREALRLLADQRDWSIDLRLLAGGRVRIWRAAKYMRQLGIRQHVLRSRETLDRTGPETVAGEHRLDYL